MHKKLSLKLNYLFLARKRQVKLTGFVGVECNVDFRLGKNATLVLGKGLYICKGSVIGVDDNAVLKLGDNVFIGHGATLHANQSIEIGSGTMIAEYVSIRDHDHNYRNMQFERLIEKGFISAPVQIGNNVWIGCKSTITKGVHIGNNAVVGANSVVTRDVPARTMVVGAPAKAVKKT
jgi:acetyltransferase-like isoleucine patch superfamily enzyme